MKKLSLLMAMFLVTTLGAMAYPTQLYIWGAINNQGWTNTDGTYMLSQVSEGVYEGTFNITHTL